MIEQLLSNLKYDPPGPPGEGPQGVEFIGEQPVTGFINGTALASRIGLTVGIAQHDNEPWLHFVLDGKTLYVAKKPYRHSVTWSSINNAGAVFGTKTVTINKKTYKVRLLKTIASGDIVIYRGSRLVYDPVEAYDSEWNRLMYPIHSGKHIDTGNPPSVSGEGIQFGTLAQYTDTDLLLHRDAGDGSYSWCQETRSGGPTNRVARGYEGVSYLSWHAVSPVYSFTGWRPVLELVG